MTLLNRLLGLNLDPSKETPPSNNLILLGAAINIHNDHIEASLPLKKRNDLSHDIREVLRRDQLSPAQAAKLRGRLGWAQSLLFGRFGRAHLAPLTERQYSLNPSSRQALNSDIRCTLQWWLEMLRSPTPRKVLFRQDKPTLVYSDACGAGHLGAMVFVGGVRTIVHTHVPAWLAAEANIFELEQAGTILGLLTAREVRPGPFVVLGCDNFGASGAIIRGSAGTVLGRQMSAVFWAAAARSSTGVWVESVLGKLNPADPPSRICEMLDDKSQVEGVTNGPPLSFIEIFRTKESFLKAQYYFNSTMTGFGDAFPCLEKPSQTTDTKSRD